MLGLSGLDVIEGNTLLFDPDHQREADVFRAIAALKIEALERDRAHPSPAPEAGDLISRDAVREKYFDVASGFYDIGRTLAALRALWVTKRPAKPAIIPSQPT